MVSVEDLKSGDTISFSQKGIKQKGMVLPRSELFDTDIIVVKLENGYNIGVKKNNVDDLKIISSLQLKKPEQSTTTHNKDLPTVVLLSFGGTISSRLDYRTGGVVADYTADDFVQMMPELKSIANVEAVNVDTKMSEDLQAADWEKITLETTKHLNRKEVTGVIVTQGTDTLHYSTSAVSFMLGEINKPVVFTAAQRSIDRGSSDAFENIICAVKAAVQWDGACVVTCMHEKSSDGSCLLIRGTKVRKMHTSRRDAFRPINEQPLARLGINTKLEIINANYPKRCTKSVEPKTQFESKIGLLHVYPGMQTSQLQYFIDNDYKGLVIASTALGHVPEQLLDTLKVACDKMLVVNASQTIYGRVHPYVYSRLRKEAIEIGLLFADDMLVETAYAKLGWVLANTDSKEAAISLFKENVAGEMAGEIDEKSYLL